MRFTISLAALVALAFLMTVSAEPQAARRTVTRTIVATRTATRTPARTIRSTVTRTVACNNRRDELEERAEKPEATVAPGIEFIDTDGEQHALDPRSLRCRALNDNASNRLRQQKAVAGARTVYRTRTTTVTVNARRTNTVRSTTTQTVCSRAASGSNTRAASPAAAAPRTTTTVRPASATPPSSSPAASSPAAQSSASPSASPVAQAASGPGYNGATGAFAPNNLKLHNDKRALHFNSTLNTAPLAWNETLAQFSLDYGLKCLSTHSGGPYGENLAWVTGKNDSETEAYLFQLWYDESIGYDYSKNTFEAATGHFTQLVWRGTTQVGCALVNCPGAADGGLWGPNRAYISLTCEYSPPGNVRTRFTNNVLPPGNQ